MCVEGPAGKKKPAYEIEMGVIGKGEILVPLLIALVIGAVSVALAFWFVG